MDRRGFLRTSTATLAAGLLKSTGEAQVPGGQAQAPLAAAPSTGPVKKLKVDMYSRHLQWLRSADEVAKATIEMGFTGVDITVRPYPGHVDPAKVATDLPPFVKAIRAHGLEVNMITCPITDADSQYAEEILKTAASLDIHHYWWGTFRYEDGKPVMAQLDALKPRVEKLQALNKKYEMKAMYHLYSMASSIGCNVWDMLYVLRNFDPKYVSLHWDVGHTSITGGNGTWVQALRAAGPYVGGLSVKEYTWELDLQTPEGGVFNGKPADLQQRFGRPPGAPGAGAPGGASRPAPPAAPPVPGAAMTQAQQQAAAERGVAAPGAAPAGGRGPGGPRAPLSRGGGGQPLPWREKTVPLGEGVNNLPLLATVLKEINFDGPVEIQAEYPNGGAENAQDKLTLPVPLVLGNMKRDLLALKAAFGPSGLL
jgi:sugar phosphate isomerase/epimerase